jgi:hypothetical protein
MGMSLRMRTGMKTDMNMNTDSSKRMRVSLRTDMMMGMGTDMRTATGMLME